MSVSEENWRDRASTRVLPDNETAHYWLGKAYLKTGDRQSALRHYAALKQIDQEKAEQLLREIKGQ